MVLAMRFLRASAMVAAVVFPTTDAMVLRGHGAANTTISEVPTNQEITAKYDKMDDFMEIMFTMACTWKHGKDVHGAAKAAGQEKGLDARGVRNFKEELRSKNVKQLTNACGTIVSSQKGQCRISCGQRWGDSMEKRNDCDKKCVKAYDNFERSCSTKAASLEKVYSMKVKMATAREQCYQGWCEEFPSAWMKADAAAMAAEVDTQCGKRCTADKIKARCENKFNLEVDFFRTKIESDCHDEGKDTVDTCYKTKADAAGTKSDTCESTGHGTCDTQFSECKTKGETDKSHKSAEEFCVGRQKMCKEQVTKSCVSDHKAEIEKAKDDCEAEAKTDAKTCFDKALETKEKDEVAKCEGDLTPKCPEDCKKKCDTEKMGQCLANLESDTDPAEEFCKDFWRLLHESSEVDPITGNPIVLLSKNRA